jgi:hypothetical protein
MRRLICLLAVISVSSGCGQTVKEGTVVGKEHDPARHYTVHEQYVQSQICNKIGSVTSCVPIYATRTYEAYDDPDWILFVKDAKGHLHKVYCTPSDWKGYVIGDEWHRQPHQPITDGKIKT